MTVSIHGIMSHRKLMELKNCGVVEPEFFESEVTKYFNLYRLIVAESLFEMNSGFFTRLFYSRSAAERDARWMFPDRRDLLEHLIYLDGQSKYISLTKDELDRFTMLHQAAVASERAKQVLLCFKYSDQVLVDDDSGFNIDWLMKNAYVLKGLIANAREEE
ncbi:hypothetical protein [Salmonella phage NINP13076]|uniref:Uncharacterized protein n=1 Tax=Salmonella phage SalP219 TaxID=3158864 RepID=A0AAU7PHZ3_9CAUD|nr:hypothetical protein [Salmonella phage NINP13076]